MPDSTLSPENQDALDDLLVAIEAGGRRLGIFIAVCDDPLLRDELIAAYEQELAPEFKHYRLKLNPDAPSLRALVAQQVEADEYLRQNGKAVMTVLGAEALRQLSFDDEQSQQDAFFGYLQWTREGLQSLPYAIVLWVTYQLQEQLSRKAPDFWSWRQDVIRFVSPKRQAIETDRIPALMQHERFAAVSDANTVSIADLEALVAETEANSSDSPLLASLYSQLGSAYVSRVETGQAQDYRAEMKKATAYLEKSIQRLQKSIAKKDYAESLSGLARSFELQGFYGEAELLYMHSLTVCKVELKRHQLDIAVRLNCLAAVYHQQKRYAEAELLYQEALEIRQSELSAVHPSVADVLDNIAILHNTQGNYDKAEKLFREVLAIRRQSQDRAYAISLNNIATFYDLTGSEKLAEVHYLESLKISRQVVGPDHPIVASSLYNLAELYRSQSTYRKSLAFYLDSLVIREKALGIDHPDTRMTVKRLKSLYQIISQ